MKKLRNYDVENTVRNTLIVLMLINAIVLTTFLSTYMVEEASLTFINSTIYKLSDILLWPLGIITYIVTIIYFVAAIKSKKEKFFKIMLAITSLFSNILTISLIAIWITKIYN